MNTIGSLLVVALAITAEAGMMGPPGGVGGGPPGVGAGPPPFVQAIIAGKGKPFAGGPGAGMGGGPPGGIGAGPPPFVQAIIAGKGKPFAGGPPAPPAAAPAPIPDPMPAYIQSLLAAKMASAFMPPTIPMGPPAFVTQLIAAKNAAAAQQAAEEAAAAQELAAYQAQTAGASGSPLPSMNDSRPLAFGAPPFVQSIIAQKGSPSAASPTAAAPPDWIQELLQTQIAKKAAAKLSPGLSAVGLQPQPSQLGSPNPVAQSGPVLQTRQADEGVPQQSAAPAPVQYAQPQPLNPYGLPQPGPFAPMPYPMMPFPFFNPMMPLWKMG